MHVVAVIASASVPVKVLLVCLVAITCVVVYRRAFPRTVDGQDAAHTGGDPRSQSVAEVPRTLAASAGNDRHSLPGPLIDPRPRMRCPQCSEFILTEARLCRFCGFRFAQSLEARPE
jgi:hypothetical protein